MVEFGDELVLQSLRIPWLIWIQLLVMFLLLLLLYSLTSSSPSDAPSSSSSSSIAAADAPSPSSSPSSSSPPPLGFRKQFLPARGAHQVEESQGIKGFIATSASRRVAVEEDEMEVENSSHSYMDHHPCSIVRLARIAFLKCLGLDFTSENSSFKRHRR